METKESKIGLQVNETPIFALDIGTRSVVGILGVNRNGEFHILDYEQAFHPERAMRDGQIENIELVADVVRQVKSSLESRCKHVLTSVSIAAAGRALKTKRVTYEQALDPTEEISLQLIQAMEYAAVAYAQEEFYREDPDTSPAQKSLPALPSAVVFSPGSQKSASANRPPVEITDSPAALSSEPLLEASSFFCVGYSVVNYQLDGYVMDNLINHKGKRARIDLIAAFLPQNVVESLYAVTRLNDLAVYNLTLEPIAAINVIVPKDIRLLNIALVDIGAGTSDIAISKNGSIVAYDMATIAGDEITESIMQNYLTSFSEGENIKLALSGSTPHITFHDILGNEHKIEKRRILKTIRPAIQTLAEAISKKILSINEVSPLAVFLVGGGSQIPELCPLVAQQLKLPSHRVAVGGKQSFQHIHLCAEKLQSPEFITPIGIGAVSSLYKGCDFFSITVNGKRLMLLNYGDAKVLDALLLASIKPKSLIGVSSKSLVYFINGERVILRGSCSTPGELYVNSLPASIDTRIKQGDEIVAIPAIDGTQPAVTIGELLENYPSFTVTLDGMDVTITPVVKKRNRVLKKTYSVQPQDVLEIPLIRTIADLFEFMERDVSRIILYQNGFPVTPDALVQDGDQITTTLLAEPLDTVAGSEQSPPVSSHAVSAPEETAVMQSSPPAAEEEISPASDPSILAETFVPIESPIPSEASAAISNSNISVCINGQWTSVLKNESGKVFFFDLLNYVDIDPKNPQGAIVLKLNGKDAGYTDPIADQDIVELRWEK